MTALKPATDLPAWKGYEKVVFRIAFLYFVIQAFPLDWKFYRNLFTTIIGGFHFQDLFRLTTYMPHFIPAEAVPGWGIASYADWGIILILAVGGAIMWGLWDKNRKEYNLLYYYLRVLLRYRLSIAVIAFGILKIFSLQLPGPTLSELHTNYGDFLPWKVYSLTNGVAAAYYQPTLGLIEIVGGVLLLFRKTVTIGAGLITAFLINVLIANVAYDIGQHVYSAYLLVIAIFLLSYDIPRLYKLLVLKTAAGANRFRPVLSGKKFANVRVALKAGFVSFILLLGFTTFADRKKDGFPFPKNPALAGAYGYYNVTEFRLNNQVIPYSLTDSSRWQDVVFEKWGTVSIKSTRFIQPDLSNPQITWGLPDIEKNYESAGIAGRHFYTYQADTVNQVLSLTDKNKNYNNEKLQLKYSRPDSNTIILSGINERSDSVYVVLNKIDKQYLLKKGRRKPIKI